MSLSGITSHNTHDYEHKGCAHKKSIKQANPQYFFHLIEEKFLSLKEKTIHTFHSIKAKFNNSEHLHVLFYQITLIGTIILAKVAPQRRPWWSTINKNIMLGAQPQRNDGKKLFDIQVGAVLTLQEPYELETRPVIKPVTAEQWEKLGIQRVVLNCVDLEPLSDEVMEKGYLFMKEVIDTNHIVYVHCKSGEGRSATMVAIYLTLSKMFKTIDEALKYMKNIRPQVNPNEAQLVAARKFVERYSAKSCV